MALLEDAVDTTVTFKSLGLIDPLVQAVEMLGFQSPTKIQSETIPIALSGKDIIAIAQTGSGKTAAYALPILQALHAQPAGLFACIIVPTRELGYQVAEQFDALGSSMGVKCCVVVGGVDPMEQAIGLAKKPHILIGTPGRLIYHLELTRGFGLHRLKYLVLDEADRLLSMDFGEELDKLVRVLPKDRKTYLFSATMTQKVHKLQRASLNNPVKVEVSTKYQTVDTLNQQYLFIPFKYRECYLVHVLNDISGNSVIVFVASCATSARLTLMLRNLGFAAVPINGDMPQAKRMEALDRFKAGERNILIATDVAARGIDIPNVDMVINYDVPLNPKEYIHRVGRTARAGRTGRALTFVSQYDVESYQRIETLLEKKLDAYNAEEDVAMALMMRVNEAMRLSVVQMRDLGIAKMEGSEEANTNNNKKRPVPQHKKAELQRNYNIKKAKSLKQAKGNAR